MIIMCFSTVSQIDKKKIQQKNKPPLKSTKPN